jgi:hypothetical protein
VRIVEKLRETSLRIAASAQRQGLRKPPPPEQEVERESFPADSLKHLYTKAENDTETNLARKLRTPTPAGI